MGRTDRIHWFHHHSPPIVPILWAAATLVGQLFHGGFSGLLITDDQYFTYGENQNVSAVRLSYFFGTLQISDIGDYAVYFLNPRVLTEDGEWEAWLFAAWLPGAVRFPSFWDLILTFDLCMTDEVRPGTTTHFEYDASGNRDWMTINGVMTDYTYNSLDQLISAGSVTYDYDGRGNLHQVTDGSQTTMYTYNATEM